MGWLLASVLAFGALQLPIPDNAPEWLIIFLLLVNAYLEYLARRRSSK